MDLAKDYKFLDAKRQVELCGSIANLRLHELITSLAGSRQSNFFQESGKDSKLKAIVILLPYGYTQSLKPIKTNASIQKRFDVCQSLSQKYFELALKNGPNGFIIESIRNLQQLLFLRSFFKCVVGNEIQEMTQSLIANSGKYLHI